MINAPPSDGVFLIRKPLVPTASETTTVSLSFCGSAGVEGVVLGVVDGVGDGLVVGVVVDAGGSLTEPGAGSVTGAGVAPATFSRNHAAATPSLPPGSRTRTHWLLCPIFAESLVSSSNNCVPAGTEATTFAMLDVLVLLRMFKPQVTE